MDKDVLGYQLSVFVGYHVQKEVEKRNYFLKFAKDLEPDIVCCESMIVRDKTAELNYFFFYSKDKDALNRLGNEAQIKGLVRKFFVEEIEGSLSEKTLK